MTYLVNHSQRFVGVRMSADVVNEQRLVSPRLVDTISPAPRNAQQWRRLANVS